MLRYDANGDTEDLTTPQKATSRPVITDKANALKQHTEPLHPRIYRWQLSHQTAKPGQSISVGQ